MSMEGLSKSRLERMRQVLSGYVERKEMPGLVALVSRHDDLHVETLGAMSFGHPAPMKRDTIFVSLRQSGVGTGFVRTDATLPKGHVLFKAKCGLTTRWSRPGQHTAVAF